MICAIMTSAKDKKILLSSTDGGFKRVIIVSTALIFAAVFGWLSCMERKLNGDVDFRWHWSALLWVAIGIASMVYFWRQIWPTQNDGIGSKHKRLIKGWAALLIPSLMWMAYPLRFISGQRLFDVFFGLMLAAMVLTLGGCMVFRLIKGFNENEPTDKEKS
jgi:hypothetical protein